MNATEQPVRVDLRGLSPDEVVELLRSYGFSIKGHQETDLFKQSSLIYETSPEDQKRVVHQIWIENKEASRLRVVIYNGTEHQLREGHDLFFFEGPHGGWSWARTYYLMA